ncbi:hypothetical protein [Paraburkholderia phenazinium]|uniref:hypothetical protein n=1 Tax=Paraburkholderia phenazinium TaxID=60549 RepID=UPI00158E163F|nr:hypothetical protein [Paraburkholderia phenazinium]
MRCLFTDLRIAHPADPLVAPLVDPVVDPLVVHLLNRSAGSIPVDDMHTPRGAAA